MAGRRIEHNFNQGWGVAAFVTLLAVAGFATAFMINQRTFHSPNDVTAPTNGEAAHAPAAAPAKH
jgi:hypothetical protein